MKKNNTMLVIITVIIIVLVVSVVGISYLVYKDITGDKKVNEWEELINSKENKVLYFGRNGCTWCVKYKPVLEALKEKYGVSYEYIDTDLVSGFEELLARLGIDYSKFATPDIVIVKKGKKVAELSGYKTPDELFEFYKKYNFIDKDVKYEEINIDEAGIIINSDKEAYPYLNILTYNDYLTMLNNSSKNILVIGQTTCGYCNQYKPILNEIAFDKNIIINYIDITTLTQNEYQEFLSSLSYFNESKNWGTPLTLIVQDKKVIDYSEGMKNKKETISYYEGLGIIK